MKEIPKWVEPYLKGLDTAEKAHKYLTDLQRDLENKQSEVEELEAEIEEIADLIPHIETYLEQLDEQEMTPEERDRRERIAAINNPNQMKFNLAS